LGVIIAVIAGCNGAVICILQRVCILTEVKLIVKRKEKEFAVIDYSDIERCEYAQLRTIIYRKNRSMYCFCPNAIANVFKARFLITKSKMKVYK